MANTHMLRMLQTIHLKWTWHRQDFLRDALRADLAALCQAAIVGACLGTLPWLVLELAGLTGTPVRLVGAIAATLGGVIGLGLRLAQTLAHARAEYRTYAHYRRRGDV